MPLPKIDQPLFELTIPSTKQKVKYRPFSVKEEKILLIARESGELDQVLLAIQQVVQNCIQDEIDVEKLATFDLEYIILNIRGKAVNDELEFEVNDPEEDGKKIKLTFNINDIEIARIDEHETKLDLNEDYFLFMRYPTIAELTLITKGSSATSFDMMTSCIDKLVTKDGETFYKMTDFTVEEVNDFVESLSSTAINKIQTFFTTLPAMRMECPYVNSNGEDKKFVIEGVQTFFM